MARYGTIGTTSGWKRRATPSHGAYVTKHQVLVEIGGGYVEVPASSARVWDLLIFIREQDGGDASVPLGFTVR